MPKKLKKLAAALSLIALGTVAVFIFINWSFFSFYFFPETDPYIPFEIHRAAQPVAQNLLPNLLLIPSLGIKAPVGYPEKTDENEFQNFLQNGVVHYPGTALPGQPGNVYIFGHSSDYIWSKG